MAHESVPPIVQGILAIAAFAGVMTLTSIILGVLLTVRRRRNR